VRRLFKYISFWSVANVVFTASNSRVPAQKPDQIQFILRCPAEQPCAFYRLVWKQRIIIHSRNIFLLQHHSPWQ